ncbi:hypothetical protein [Caulobacter sp. DWR1-3-2b1]|uniref:hypothetical protein n=1 Tax=Caulobacter sp. DWR1-3-2b1 TaxID=2804670 RepID=UPI003CECD15A
MLKKFFESFRTPKCEDPFFGTLLFMKAARGYQSYWEGEKIFVSGDGAVEIGLSIDTSSESDGPSEKQRDFFSWVEANFGSICLAIDKHLQADPWSGHVTIKPFAQEFTVSHLSIPLCNQTNEEWEISFDSGSDPEHLYAATLTGLTVTNIAMDG